MWLGWKAFCVMCFSIYDRSRGVDRCDVSEALEALDGQRYFSLGSVWLRGDEG